MYFTPSSGHFVFMSFSMNPPQVALPFHTSRSCSCAGLTRAATRHLVTVASSSVHGPSGSRLLTLSRLHKYSSRVSWYIFLYTIHLSSPDTASWHNETSRLSIDCTIVPAHGSGLDCQQVYQHTTWSHLQRPAYLAVCLALNQSVA